MGVQFLPDTLLALRAAVAVLAEKSTTKMLDEVDDCFLPERDVDPLLKDGGDDFELGEVVADGG